MGIYAPAKTSLAVSALPQAFYDAIADTGVHSYTLDRGRYTVPSRIDITRGDLALDLNGSSLLHAPVAGGIPILFYTYSIVDAFVDEASPTRNTSHLTGTITAGTTTLTMDANEIMDVVPGERVTIVAGTNPNDPVEPLRYIQATVLSVGGAGGRVITFAAPLGQNITTYASEEEYKTFVDPGLWDKIGTWGADYNGANYKKGLGFDHGLMRYVGERVSNVTIKNFHIENTMPTDANLAVGMYNFLTISATGVTIRDFSVNNVPGVMSLSAGCDDFLIDNVGITGTGRGDLTPGVTFPGIAFANWGGDGITVDHAKVRGQNITLVSMEVSPINVVLRNIDYDVQISNNWSNPAEAIIWQFSADVPARIEDSSINVTAQVGDFSYEPGVGDTNVLKDLVIPRSTFGAPFFFATNTIEGNITVGGNAYGPLTADTETVNVPGTGTHFITLPKGFYKSGRFRTTVAGGANEMADGWGNYYSPVPSAWTDFLAAWFLAPTGALASNYFDLQKWQINFTSGVQATFEFEISYYPAPDDAGFVVS